MTYTIVKKSDGWRIETEDGDIIGSGTAPYTLPDDAIDAILDDMGIGAPQADAFKVLFKQDWVYIDER